jgi:hypothetical protein
MGLERWAILLAVLALCACKAEPPALPTMDRFTSNDGSWQLQVEPPLADCALNEPCSFAVRVERADAAQVRRLRLEVDAAMPDHRHGLNARPQVSGNARDGFQVEGLLLHMPGYWEIYFDLTEGPVTERAQAAVER